MWYICPRREAGSAALRENSAMTFIGILFRILLYFVGIVLVLLLAAFLSGRDRRAYAVLSESSTVTVAGQSVRLPDLARKYQPAYYLQPNISNPPLRWVWYNAVDAGDHIDLIYYMVWANEVNPQPFIHAYYSIFRAAYYGYPLYDIEYFQIGIQKSDGAIQCLMFETGPSDNFYSVFNTHIVVEATRQGADSYMVRQLDRTSRVELGSVASAPEFDGDHVKVGVQTWNHLSTLVTADNAGRYTQPVSGGDLRYLSDADYSNYKFVRKSQGSHVTQESSLSVLWALPASVVLVTLPFWALSGLQKIFAGKRDATHRP